MSSRRSARNKTASSKDGVTSAVDAPATTTENENKSPANVNNEDMVVEAVAESNQGSESEIQCGICFDDIACRGVIDSCDHTCKYFLYYILIELLWHYYLILRICSSKLLITS